MNYTVVVAVLDPGNNLKNTVKNVDTRISVEIKCRNFGYTSNYRIQAVLTTYLMEKMSSLVSRTSSSRYNIIKELATRHVLHNNKYISWSIDHLVSV